MQNVWSALSGASPFGISASLAIGKSPNCCLVYVRPQHVRVCLNGGHITVFYFSLVSNVEIPYQTNNRNNGDRNLF